MKTKGRSENCGLFIVALRCQAVILLAEGHYPQFHCGLAL
jgi:hypothetical protein